MITIDEKVVRTLSKVTREEWEAILILAQKMLGRPNEIVEEINPIHKVEENPNHLSIKILDLLKEIGIPPHLLGYKYLREAIMLVCQDSTYLNNVNNKLFVVIAEKYDSNSSRVERAIRHAVETAFNSGRSEVHEKVFKGIYSPEKGKPTNNHAIAALAEYVKLYC